MKFCLENVSLELERCQQLNPGFQAKENLYKIYRAFYVSLSENWWGNDTLTKSQLKSWLKQVEDDLVRDLPELKGLLGDFFKALNNQIRANQIGLSFWDRIMAVAEQIFPDPELATLLLNVGQNVLYNHRPNSHERAGHAKWMQGSCPACSALPHYGILTKEGGVKVLECWRCSTRWVFPRLMCPYCVNNNQHQLGYFTLQEDSYYRVQFCQKCGKYHKVFDARSLDSDDIVLSIHNLATLAADQVALREGFTSGSGLVWTKIGGRG